VPLFIEELTKAILESGALRANVDPIEDSRRVFVLLQTFAHTALEIVLSFSRLACLGD